MASPTPATGWDAANNTVEKYPVEHHESIPAFDDKTLVQEAKLATAAEHELTFIQAMKVYHKAVFWSILVSLCIVMEGYDNTLIGSFFAYPSFQKKYGKYYGPQAGWQLSSPWQAGITDIGSIGNIIGAMLNGYLTHKYGHRKVMMGALASMTAFLFITFFAPNVQTLLVGAFLCSIPWGIYATMGPAYAAEVCPLTLRGYLTAYVNLCWIIGQFLSAAVLRGLVNNKTQWGYRIPFAIQWIWPIPLLIGAWFCPDSPWWLVRAGRYADAEKSLKRLSRSDVELDHKSTVALMIHTTALEKEADVKTSYKDCFKGTNLRRTEIACIAFLCQVANGGYLVYSPTYFLEQAGISATTAYSISLGATGVAFVGTCLSWPIMARFGRRTIFLVGYIIMNVSLLFIAILACVPAAHGIKWAQVVFCFIWIASNATTIGPVVYTIVSEIGATQLRTKTVVLGRSTYYIGNIIGGVLEPYMMNPSQWNLKGKTAFFWFGTSLCTIIWGFFRLPETKDRTFEELDIMFLRKLPTRKFVEENLDDVFEVGA